MSHLEAHRAESCLVEMGVVPFQQQQKPVLSRDESAALSPGSLLLLLRFAGMGEHSQGLPGCSASIPPGAVFL